MRRGGIALIVACLMLAVFAGPALAYSVSVSNSGPSGNVYIPKGTLIDAELITGVNSGENGAHDIAYFKIKQNVIVNGVVVLPSGTVGCVYVTSADSANFLGKRGKLQLKISNIQALNGAIVPLTFEIKKYGGIVDKNLPYQLLAMYSSGIHKLGLLSGRYPGGEAEIPAGTKFQVAVDYDADLGCTPDMLEAVMVKRR
ncbi:MAG TPA: hypothetical protein PKA10_19895 [Selenomonadales bacterium]|nr:hypothetical protein [Selenomonadales bacterium]